MPCIGPIYNLFKSVWILLTFSSVSALFPSFVLSANLRSLLTMSQCKSFMYIINRRGPKNDLWVTPLITLTDLDALPFMTTLCFLPVSQFLIQSTMAPRIPKARSLILISKFSVQYCNQELTTQVSFKDFLETLNK